MSTDQQAPVWARPEVFPAKPATGAFGFMDVKGKAYPADSLDTLIGSIAKSKAGVDLVWSPSSEYLIAPEELEGLRKTLAQRRAHWAGNDISDGKRLSALMAAALAWAGYAAYHNHGGQWHAVFNTPTVAITAIMLLIFGLVPWYEGWKELRKASKRDALYWEKEIADARFDSWLGLQPSPFTLVLLAVMVVTGISQWLSTGGVDWAGAAVEKVGLLKSKNPLGSDSWWRYFTAPLVHGNLVHWLMNFASLRYLARRAEVLARWPHMLVVFAISAFVGGMTTVQLMPNVPSVGASGGILGLLGFLLVFETLHQRLVPKSARKRLLAGLVMVAVMGFLGFTFIDNAAHAGGLAGGMVYALLVFPPSSSVVRPEVLFKDRLVGALVVALLVGATVLSVFLLLD